ncbi:unnamed protein product [Rotaria magnacalcarata]|uniref:General transcription factor 3C polypeptide 3 n=11 Tax=Rotaria magnacalcarata TaxID=392030 RepID=A0A816YEV7_9BILA|nr:unnamed protein product [Rotaria magnacalcarata]CAF1661458.1 unnamed protein product [Rotaria magnacalcarata]CAF2157824.1 unnamed protein product [Rotaria magnacalcarata]
MTASNKFIKHFRDLQAGESEKAGAAETLAYLNGELSFQEYEKRVREANTDYSNVSVGKVLDTREAEIVDIDELIDEMSDLDDLSGLSSASTSDNSDESQPNNESLKRKKNDSESKAKRRRRKKQQQGSDENSDDDEDECEEKVMDPNEMRNRMVQHLEQMRLAKQKKKKQTNKSKNRKCSAPSVSIAEKVPKSRLNQECQALMGEANMAYAHGDIQKAIRICQELITKVPNAAEPYLTIARIYEDQNDHNKAFEMSFVAAHCQRSKDSWLRMLDECQQRKADDLITTCFNNIVKLDPTDVNMHLKRIEHVEKHGTRKLYLSSLQSLLAALHPTENPEQKPIYLEKYRILIQAILASERKDSELQTLFYKGLRDLGTDFPSEYIERLLQMQYNSKLYPELLKNLINFTGVRLSKFNTELELPIDTTDLEDLKDADFLLPEFYRTDYYGMFLVAITDFGCSPAALRLLPNYKSNVRSTDQLLCLDVMSALALNDHLIEACQLFEHLSSLSKLSAQSWFQYSEWLIALSKFHEAYEALEQTLRLDSQYNEARLSLSALQKQIGLNEQSQHTLAEVVSRPIKEELNDKSDFQDENDDDDEQQEVTVEKIHLLVERCITLYDQNQLTFFIPCAMQLFFGSIKYLLTVDCSKRLINCGTRARRLELIQKLVDEKRIILNPSYTRINTVLKNRIIDLYGKFCDVLIHVKRHDLLLRVTAAGTVIPFLYARIDWLILTEFLLFISLMLQQNGDLAFQTCREIFRCYSKSSVIQNLFALTATITPSVRLQKFCVRSLQKRPNSPILHHMVGNFALIGGTYRLAIIHYMKLFRLTPNEPLVSLLLAISFVHVACQKYAYSRHQRVLHALAFLKHYRNLRGECTETYYNIGRLMHFLSLHYAAAYFYHKCLETESPIVDTDDIYGLKYQAAYNLALIYKASKNEKFARHIIRTYMTL